MEKEQELNNASANAAEQAQSAISLEDELSLEINESGDDVESLKAQLVKAQEERDNYKRGMFKYKNKSQDSSDEEDEGEEENQEAVVPDVKAIATQAATELIEKNNEKSAISQFTSKYPALKDPSVWRKVIENYNPKAGKGSVNSIMQDLEAALILARHYGGGKIAEKEVSLNNYASVSYAGSIAPHNNQSPDLKDSTIEMGRYFGNSAEALKKASEPGANEIQLI